MLDDVFSGWDRGLVAADAHAAYERGDFRHASELYRQALEADPHNAALATRRASALLLSNQYEAGLVAGREAMRLAPDASAPSVYAAGSAMAMGEIDTALELAEEARRRDATDAAALLCHAEVLRTAGRTEPADAALREAYRHHPRDPRVLSELAERLASPDESPEVPEQLDALADEESIHRSLRAVLQFSLGRLRERGEDFPGAFAAFERANALTPDLFDPTSLESFADETIATWTRERVAALPDSGLDTRAPVFIVGMPRTGSTLVEQIISSHPEAVAGGEMPHFAQRVENLLSPPLSESLDAFTRDSLRGEARAHLAALDEIAPGAQRVTDKLLSNFLHLGLVRAMYPRAAIIHCTRRPLDAALSCWQHNFRGAVSWSGSFKGIAAFHREHDRLMAHWRDECGVEILTVPYEDLVSDPAGWSRRLIEHVGLGWDEACLSPHENARAVLTSSREQVREPIHGRAARRADRYGSLLDPLREALERAGVNPDGG